LAKNVAILWDAVMIAQKEWKYFPWAYRILVEEQLPPAALVPMFPSDRFY
jgi:hypothetical protein